MISPSRLGTKTRSSHLWQLRSRICFAATEMTQSTISIRKTEPDVGATTTRHRVHSATETCSHASSM